jgi:soluble lytic murein transglycosylase-like protein
VKFALLIAALGGLFDSTGGIPDQSLLYVREAQYRPVVLAMTEGESRGALAALSGFVGGPHGPLGREEEEGLAFLRGKLLVDLGEGAEAELALREVALAEGLFADEARYLLGSLAIQAGQRDAAVRYWNGLLPWSGHASDASRKALALLLGANPDDKARVLFERLVAGQGLDLRRMEGIPPEWWPAGRKDEASPFRATLKQLRRSLKKAKTPKARAGVVTFERGRQGPASALGLLVEAVAACDPAFPGPSNGKFGAALERDPSVGLRRVVLEEWIRCAVRYSAPDDALRLLAEYRREHAPSAAFPATVRRALPVLTRGDGMALGRELARDLAAGHASSRTTPKVLFQLGLAAFQARQDDEAHHALEALLRVRPRGLTDGAVTWEEKALYWLGRVDLRQGRLKDGLGHFSELATRYPVSSYRLLAESRLSALTREPLLPVEAPRAPGPLPTYLVYQDLGLNAEAHDELAGLLAAGQVVPQQDLNLYLYLDPLVARRPAHKLLYDQRGTVPFPLTGAPEEVARTVFDLPFDEEVEEAARAFGVSPHLFAALVRKESGFKESARSWAGALGLAQVMPSVARYVIDQVPLPVGKTTGDILKPRNNLMIGAAFLQSLIKGFRSVPLAVLAYNIGPGRVSDLLARFPQVDEADLFLEVITSRGGRDYALKVLAWYSAYARLYDGPLPPLDLAITVRPKEIPIIKGGRHASSGEGHPGM